MGKSGKEYKKQSEYRNKIRNQKRDRENLRKAA